MVRPALEELVGRSMTQAEGEKKRLENATGNDRGDDMLYIGGSYPGRAI